MGQRWGRAPEARMASVWKEEIAGGWKVQWRNRRTQAPDGRQLLKKPSVVVATRANADKLMVHVRSILEIEHFYIHEPPPEVQIADFAQVAADYMAYKRSRGTAESTIEVYRSGYRRIGATMRALEGLGNEPIPVTLLSIDLCTRLRTAWTDVRAQRIYDLSLYLIAAWRFGASQPARYPAIPQPPRDESLVLPEPPVRVLAPPPTLVELDAICRRAAASPVRDLRDILATLRLTGLRIGQVLSIRAHDVDLGRSLLTVATGKSKREKAEKRKVPMHHDLVNLLRPRIDGAPSDALLFPPLRGNGLRSKPDAALSKLWRAATEAGETREDVWKPDNRNKGRPFHAFRAGFLHALRRADVDEEARHALVGHAPSTTEQRHYADVLDEKLRKAIDALHGIDWIGPEAKSNVTPIRLAPED